MVGRDVSRPYRVWFFAEGELFFMFLFLCPQYLSTESVVWAKKISGSFTTTTNTKP